MSIKKKLFIFGLVLLVVAGAAAGDLEGSLLERVLGLTGIGALVGLFIDQVLKRFFPVFMEGKSALIVAAFNLLLMVVMLITDFLGLSLPWENIDNFAHGIYQFALLVLGLLGMQIGAKALHEVGRGTFLSNSIS